MADPVTTTANTSFTTGKIATQLNEPLHRILYAVRTRGISPTSIAGNVRVFEAEQVEQIASALRDIDSRREGGASCNP